MSEQDGDSDWFEEAVGDDDEDTAPEDWDATWDDDEDPPEAPTVDENSPETPEPAITDSDEEADSNGPGAATGLDTPEDDTDESAFAGLSDGEDADTAPDQSFEELSESAPDDEQIEQEFDEDVADDQPDEDGEALFEDDFAAALSETDVPSPSNEPDSGGSAGDEFSMTGSSGGMDPNDSALDMGTDDLGGFGDLGGSGGDGFDADEEALDSDIDRINLGVEGLDAMIQGGIPERTLMVAIGSPGTGKTTLGLQFLEEGLQNGEKAVYITLEESRERVIRSATEKNLAFDEYHDDGQLAVIDIDPVEMANSLQTIRSELPRLIDNFGATRLVLDSVSLLEMMYEDRATRRNEIFDFTKSLKQSGVTTLMTSEASEESPYTSRHKIVEYLTDAVFVLQYVRPSDFRETRLAIEIQKIRDAHHSRETKPYEITNDGLNVYRQANIF